MVPFMTKDWQSDNFLFENRVFQDDSSSFQAQKVKIAFHQGGHSTGEVFRLWDYAMASMRDDPFMKFYYLQW
jgi:hypothetical protein